MQRKLIVSDDKSVDLLGGCVGSDRDMIKQHTRMITGATAPLLEAITHPDMPSQSAFALLRQCIVTKIGYLARVTPPKLAHKALKKFLFTKVTHIGMPATLPAHTTRQIRLPVKLGGMGIRSMA